MHIVWQYKVLFGSAVVEMDLTLKTDTQLSWRFKFLWSCACISYKSKSNVSFTQCKKGFVHMWACTQYSPHMICWLFDFSVAGFPRAIGVIFQWSISLIHWFCCYRWLLPLTAWIPLDQISFGFMLVILYLQNAQKQTFSKTAHII